MVIPFALDRSLPVPLGVQLRGLIEYGVACGQLAPGQRLPSVRELGGQLGIAPMTVSTVYRELADAQLIVTRPGSGTFVTEQPSTPTPASPLRRFEDLIDRVLLEAEAIGIGREALIARLNARAAQRPRALRFMFVGVFPEASRCYAETLRSRLAVGDVIEAETIDRLAEDPLARSRARDADLVLTMLNRRSEVVALIGGETHVLGLSFVPSEVTRVALAGLDPLARLGVVSVFPEFLALMKAGVLRHAPHVASVVPMLLDSATADAILKGCDVVVYSTGAESVRELITSDVQAFEYRHTPDPRDIERDVLPRVALLRAMPVRAADRVLEKAT